MEKYMSESKTTQNSNQKSVIIVLLMLILIVAIAFLGYNIYKDNKRTECVKNLQSQYKDNLWLQNKIQAECGK